VLNNGLPKVWLLSIKRIQPVNSAKKDSMETGKVRPLIHQKVLLLFFDIVLVRPYDLFQSSNVVFISNLEFLLLMGFDVKLKSIIG